MKSALLLVDLQNDFLNTPDLQPSAEALLARTAALLNGCRRSGIPVLHVWTTIQPGDDRRLPHWKSANRWLCVHGSKGHETPTALRPLGNELIFHKTGFNAFANGSLNGALAKLDCDSVVIAGLHLHACVRTAAVECLDRGLRVCIADDAVASNDPVHAAATRRWLSDRCVEFESSAAILAGPERTSATLAHHSPRASDELLFEVPVQGRTEIASATATAREAWSVWRRRAIADRQRLLIAIAERLDNAAGILARQMALEIGKPLSHAREEIRRASANVRDVVRRAANTNLNEREAAGIVRRRPLGAVAIISPWNNPVAIPIGKIAPALAFGNTVVWKPAPPATRISEAILRLLQDCGLPPGAVSLLSGDHRTAQTLAADENIGGVTFTGSLAGGHAMQEICARRFIPLQAELNGNNAAIIWTDAGEREAARQVAWGAFAFAGQRCTANRRVIVHASRFDDVVQELKATGERLPFGDPLDERVEIGPLINRARREDAALQWSSARAATGACRIELLHQSSAGETWFKAGAYAQPAIVCCDDPEHSVVQNESMAPLLVVQRAEDFQHALALCNGVTQGLIASLFSHSPELQSKFLEEAQAGVLKLNAGTAGVDVSMPFGGWKASGVGPPEHGEGDALFYTRMQTVYGAGSHAG